MCEVKTKENQKLEYSPLLEQPRKQTALAEWWYNMKQFFAPDTLSQTSSKRLTSVDFLRGIAIFVMLTSHEHQSLIGGPGPKLFDKILFFVIGIPCCLTAGYRSFFVLISGISHAYVFASQCFSRPVKQVCAAQLTTFLGALAALPLFYVFHVANCIAYDFQFGSLQLGQPWWRNMEVYSHPPAFFGLSGPINVFVVFILYILVIVPLNNANQHKSKKEINQQNQTEFKQPNKKEKWQKHQILWLCAAITFSLSLIMPFIFMPVASLLKSIFESLTDTKIPGDDSNWNRECPGNYFGKTDTTFGNHLRNIFLHFLAGHHIQMNCQYMFFLAGLAIGFLLCAFKFQKTAMAQENALITENATVQQQKSVGETETEFKVGELNKGELKIEVADENVKNESNIQNESEYLLEGDQPQEQTENLQKKKSRETDNEVVKRYKKTKRYYVLIFTLTPLFVCILGVGICAQVIQQHKAGIRGKIFDFNDLMTKYTPWWCFVPEYCIYMLAVQMWLVALALWIFESGTLQKCQKRAEKILYLRRQSSYSFSCFVFGYAISQAIRNILHITGQVNIYQFFGYLTIYHSTNYLIHCWLDTFGGNFTPDFMVKRFLHVFSLGKGAFKSVAEQHLSCNPVNLFGDLK